MANNRLYIGNRQSNTYTLLSKSFGDGWDGVWSLKGITKFLLDQVQDASDGQKTNLILFTEYDDIFEEVMDNWQKYEIKDR